MRKFMGKGRRALAGMIAGLLAIESAPFGAVTAGAAGLPGGGY